ncbi:hypothetical protein SAMN02745166_00139 [Prosthecobacter debontii]|uniref:Dolichyl-phosphate-mannose-protein mannosyltransferase n=1 Tax=Prosthecobacter debontii TaxID=48467 RepID=A0A1T4WH74_9BACT|nr:hypothetical protein [Prosthecobacter debontii]SKA76265.1 hypothetical protein SAMN02745166_00139 [Prosthecobacter debontii]
MPNPSPTSSNPLFRLAFYALAIGMALTHVFITFRGLSSATGMEQAQMAREMARGNPFQTKVIRPYAWAVLTQAGRSPAPAAMPDITQPPLQPLLLAPVFKLLHRHQTYEPGKNGAIFLLDRAVACIGAAGLLLTLFWTHGSARKLFDDTIAGVTVAVLLVCEPLWELAVSGSAVALLMPLMALAVRLLVSASLAAHQDRSSGGTLFLLGMVAALMALTHWLAIWLVLGLVLAVVLALPEKRSLSIRVALIPILALTGWGWWIQQACGDPLGGAKAIFQTHLLNLDATALQRQFSLGMPPVQVTEMLRKLLLNWQTQFGELGTQFGYSFPAVCFFLALMHRFRRAETNAVKRALGALLLATALGMGFIGLPEGRLDDNQLYLTLVPALSIYGAAMLAVLWARLNPMAGGTWGRLGYAFMAVGISSLPLLNVLPAQIKLGMTMRNRIYPHWPPYVPANVSLLNKLLDPGEILFADAPWFTAWYVDVPSVWIPIKRDEFEPMKTLAEAQGAKVAGFVITPISSHVEYVHEALSGPYREWPDLIFRGPMVAFDREFPARPGFPYKVPLPLVAIPVGPKENLSLQMTFYTDRPRTVKE